jgi:DNA-binding NtrC family response regulator
MTKLAGTEVLFSGAAPQLTVRRVRLEVKRGPDKGLALELDVDPIRIGTSPGCEVRLTDAAVSGVHAELRRAPDGILLRDLGSTNGTRVDGRRVQGVFVDGSTVVSLGASDLRIVPLKDQTAVELSKDDRLGEMLGRSVVMRATFAKLLRLAKTDATVMITGETGTGKELAAAALHELGLRQLRPFVVIDCGALPANLIESELFGHERGAFTGADRARTGAFERADGGTIFLDEIGELPLSLQPALLGILERREARRVGGERPFTVDVRVITATHRDLAAEVARGAFRADLYYRLAVVEVRLPPLRERRDDIEMLIEHFLGELPGPRPSLSPEVILELSSYPWPGNVRELRNVIERAALLAEAPSPAQGASGSSPTPRQPAAADIDRPFKDAKNDLVSDFERSYVQKLLEATGGNVAAAARRAGIDRMYLYKLMQRYDVGAKPKV